MIVMENKVFWPKRRAETLIHIYSIEYNLLSIQPDHRGPFKFHLRVLANVTVIIMFFKKTVIIKGKFFCTETLQ